MAGGGDGRQAAGLASVRNLTIVLMPCSADLSEAQAPMGPAAVAGWPPPGSWQRADQHVSMVSTHQLNYHSYSLY